MEPLAPPLIVTFFRLTADRMTAARDYLGQLDGAIGDADHGSSMVAGFAAVARLSRGGGQDLAAAPLLRAAAEAFLNAVGATTGPLYASALLQAAELGDAGGHIAPGDLPLLVVAFAEGIAARGKARPGDKTMMDAWAPAARALQAARAAGQDPGGQLAAAFAAGEEGMNATRAMVASRGRAARLGERSLGHVDPGAASAVIILAALRDAFSQWAEGEAG